MEFVILFVAIIIGAYIGWYLREYAAMRKVHQMLKQSEGLFDEEVKGDPRTKMRLEKHGAMIYAYSEDDHTFLAQGIDLKELDANIRARFPDKKFSIQEQNLIDIGVYNESV